MILNSATLQWVLQDSNGETTASLKTELKYYLVSWPVSPNGNNYVLTKDLRLYNDIVRRVS
jgi:hypothetical protein